MRHEGSPHVALSSTVGKAAKLTVAERDSGNGPVWPAPGSEDAELGVLMELEVGHGEAEVYA